jgi:hypothetical protein
MTPREREEHAQSMEIAKTQADYQLEYKRLDIEVKKIEARWSSWLRLPAMLIWLPIRFIMAFAIPISVITKKELSDKYWEFMRG